MYNNFLEKNKEKLDSGNYSKALEFKTFLKTEMEKLVSK
jgi:hypothetical protein